MSALRTETKVRARALQLLYAWEMQGQPSVTGVADRLLRLRPGPISQMDRAETIAQTVAGEREVLDAEIDAVVEGWPLSRLGVVERNILRLGLRELLDEDTPPKVVIDEAVRLAHWFAGPKAPGFVNGVLDALARRRGFL